MIDTNDILQEIDEPGNGTYHVRYDPSKRASICTTIVLTVAEIEDADPLALAPLYDAVDPETLERFVESGSSTDFEGNVSFAFEGYDVTVHASGLIEIEPADG